MKLKREVFDKISAGKKIIESRLFDEKRQKLNLGDTIEFAENESGDVIKVKIDALLRYPNFEALMGDFPAAFFGNESYEENVKEINEFYSEAEIRQYGVLGIKIQVVRANTN